MTRPRTLQPGLVAALCALSLGVGPVLADSPDRHDGNHGQDGHAVHAGQAAAPMPPEAAQVRFAEVPLIDQHARQVSLEDEVVGDRIVVMGFIYTSCTTVCPVVSAIMQKVQAQLGARLESEVRLVSISIDPLRDTPARLREYASTYRAGPGWTWLTGSVPAVTATLKGLGTWSADFENHPPVIMVGDGRSEEWTRFYGFTDPALLLARVEELRAARELRYGRDEQELSMVRGERP